MTTFAEGAYPGDWLKAEQGHLLSRSQVTIAGLAAGTGTYQTGLVMARFTSGGNAGKWGPYTPGASDGTQNAAGVLYATLAMTTADAVGVVVDMGPGRVNRNALRWGSAVTTSGHRDTAVAALEATARLKAVRGA